MAHEYLRGEKPREPESQPEVYIDTVYRDVGEKETKE